MTVTIITDHKPRKLWSFEDLPKRWQKEFDYLGDDDKTDARFVKYHRWWYDTFDTQRIEREDFWSSEQFRQWDSYRSDSYFSGVLFRFDEDLDHVFIGRFYS